MRALTSPVRGRCAVAHPVGEALKSDLYLFGAAPIMNTVIHQYLKFLPCEVYRQTQTCTSRADCCSDPSWSNACTAFLRRSRLNNEHTRIAHCALTKKKSLKKRHLLLLGYFTSTRAQFCQLRFVRFRAILITFVRRQQAVSSSYRVS